MPSSVSAKVSIRSCTHRSSSSVFVSDARNGSVVGVLLVAILGACDDDGAGDGAAVTMESAHDVLR